MPLPETVALALAEHIRAHPPVPVVLPWHEPCARRHDQPVTFPLMFVTMSGGRELHSATYNTNTWRPARQRAGIASHEPGADGMHALRHYYASVLLAGGVDIRALSEYGPSTAQDEENGP